MKTVVAKRIFEACVQAAGIDPTLAGLSARDRADVANAVSEFVRRAWEEAFWPETLRVQQRHYRADWDAALTYIAGDEVWRTDGYYVSLQGGNVDKDPATETDWWEAAGDTFLRTIAFNQDGQTEIGAVDTRACIFDRDPRLYPDTAPIVPVSVYTNDDGDQAVLVHADEAPLEPYLRFRAVTPEFSWTEWAEATAYAIGDLCYLSAYGDTIVGETFRALRPNTGKNPYTQTADWEPVGFPWFLFTYVRHAVAGRLFEEDEGRYKEQAYAEAELDRLQAVLLDQRGERKRATVRLR